MPNFDFITAKEFRESLEADHAEMHRCADAKAWKGVQVLAGSIVESLLIDYLLSTSDSKRTNKDPLKLDLSEAISICRAEKVLSDRTADLCSVIRSYRNLIHPGRMVRLDEQPPTQNSSAIALSLVDMITEELAKIRRATVGLTAEQLLSKIVRDANSLTILKHLLQEVTEQQRERLLLELIPSVYEDSTTSEYPLHDNVHPEHLKMTYRTILESVSNDVRKRVASEFVRILREGDGDLVLRYGVAFFRPSDLEFVSPQHQAMVREHLLGQVSTTHILSSLDLVEGISRYLQPADVIKWLDPFIRTLTSANVIGLIKQSTRAHLLDAAVLTTKEVNDEIDRRLDKWIKHFEEQEMSEKIRYMNELKKEIEEQRILF